MTAWTTEQLDTIASTDHLYVAAYREDGTT